MSNYPQLISRVRRKVSFPTPVAGAADKLDDDVIIDYLNNAFDQLCDAIYGFDRYVEFTITALGVITVTDPVTAALRPTIAATANPAGSSYPVYTISDARSYEKIENLTADIDAEADRLMITRSPYDPSMQGTYNGNANFYKYKSILGTRGFTLLPVTINQTNTIGVTYRRKFVRFAVTDAEILVQNGTITLTRNDAANFTGIDGSTKVFRVQLDAGNPANPNTFRWSNDGGATWEATGVPCAITPTELEDGFTVTFSAVIGGVTMDAWEWTATAPLLTPLKEEEQLGFPVLRAAAECGRDLDDSRYWYWLQESQGKNWPEEIGGLLLAFREKRLTEDNMLDEQLIHLF